MPQHHGYADIGDDINQAIVKPVDSAMASLQKLSHDARANARDWATDPSNTRGAAFGKSVDYAVVALGDTLVQGVTGAVRFFTDPDVREGIANAVDHPNEAAAQVVDHVKSMDSEDWATTGFGVMAGGSGVFKKLNALSKEAALAKTLPKLSEHPVWEGYPAPSEVKAGVDADTLHLNGAPEGTSASTNGVPLSQVDIDAIKALPRGSRPNPADYLPEEYIDAHLAQFDRGASRLTPSWALEEPPVGFGNNLLGRPDGEFLMPANQLDDLLLRTKGDSTLLEAELGLDPGSLEGVELVRIDVADPRSLNLRMASGNETGANPHWIPGGKLPTGYSEAVVDRIPAGSYKQHLLIDELVRLGAK